MTIRKIKDKLEAVMVKPDGIPFSDAEYCFGHCPTLTICPGEDGFIDIEFPNPEWNVYFEAPRDIDEFLEKLDDVAYKLMKKLMTVHDDALVQKDLLSFRQVHLLGKDEDDSDVHWVLGPYQMPIHDAMDILAKTFEVPKLEPFDFYMYTNILIENSKTWYLSVHTITWMTHGVKKPKAVLTFDRGFLYRVAFEEDPDWLATKVKDSLIRAAKNIHENYGNFHDLSIVKLFATRAIRVSTES